MPMNRRLMLSATGLSLALPGFAGAQSAAFPSRVVKMVVPSVPGGATDIIGRVTANGLAKRWSSGVVVDNRPGAGTSLGAEYVAKAAPDGYTLLINGIASHAINPVVYKNIRYDPVKDFTPITLLARLPNVLLVRADFPASSLKEWIEQLRKTSDRPMYASVGNGTSPHLSAELLWQSIGIKLDHVPFKGSAPAITALLGGEVPIVFDNISGGLPFIRDGKLKALGVTTAVRSPLLPDVPTFAESGVDGYELTSWAGLCGPAGMQSNVVEQISTAAMAMLREPEVAKQFLAVGATVAPMKPAEFGSFIAEQATKFRVIAQRSNLQLT
jgi:tripartite-type tricarboxylate transporter receptor subunit TctC